MERPSLPTGIVKHWQDAHKLVKEQVRLIELSQGVHEILFLSYLVIIVTIQLFLTLSPIFRGESLSITLIFEHATDLLIGLCRLYLKCHYAEQITQDVISISLQATIKHIPDFTCFLSLRKT